MPRALPGGGRWPRATRARRNRALPSQVDARNLSRPGRVGRHPGDSVHSPTAPGTADLSRCPFACTSRARDGRLGRDRRDDRQRRRASRVQLPITFRPMVLRRDGRDTERVSPRATRPDRVQTHPALACSWWSIRGWCPLILAGQTPLRNLVAVERAADITHRESNRIDVVPYVHASPSGPRVGDHEAPRPRRRSRCGESAERGTVATSLGGGGSRAGAGREARDGAQAFGNGFAS